MLDAKLLHPACYAGTRSDTTANSISGLTVQHRGSQALRSADLRLCRCGRLLLWHVGQRWEIELMGSATLEHDFGR